MIDEYDGRGKKKQGAECVHKDGRNDRPWNLSWIRWELWKRECYRPNYVPSEYSVPLNVTIFGGRIFKKGIELK